MGHGSCVHEQCKVVCGREGVGLGRRCAEEEVMEHGVPSSIGTDGLRNKDLVVLVEALYDLLSRERR